MTRYSPSRRYLHGGLAVLAFALFSGWCGLNWAPAFVPAVLFLAGGALLLWLAFHPAVEIREKHLVIGRRLIPWADIRRVDRTGWISPLVVHLTLADRRRLTLVYPGDQDSANSLLRHLRRGAREALLDGIPYRQFWGGVLAGPVERPQPRLPRGRVLRPEDEAEVERLYQRLKTVGRLDPKNSGDEE